LSEHHQGGRRPDAPSIAACDPRCPGVHGSRVPRRAGGGPAGHGVCCGNVEARVRSGGTRCQPSAARAGSPPSMSQAPRW
jgi:hypothetical protein